MGTREIVELALQLKAEDRYLVAELLLNSLDRPDSEIDRTWAEEAEKRLRAYDAGRLHVTPIEDAFSPR